MTKLDPSQPIHSIGVVERRTGIKADLVRAWERRYGAVVPTRTETDRRLYSEADVERLTLLHEATRLGHRISHIARLSDEELGTLLEASTALAPRVGTRVLSPDLEARLAVCLRAIEDLDAAGLQGELTRASFTLSRVALVEELLVPLMEQVGARWRHGTMDPAQEHLATAAVRGFVGGFVGFPTPASGPVLVVTTPAGQHHELGALLAAAMAAAEGWRVVYLGPNLPIASIARAATRAEARAVALGITYPEASPNLVAELRALLEALAGIHLILGGRGATVADSLPASPYWTRVQDMGAFQRALARLGDVTSTGGPSDGIEG